ncbi:MAG TPA: hypothetical protein PKN66_09475 [Thermodesulfovibrio thiophilus]|nr:hypothetical protein [Thermodesulfovibrio thiophilus]
MVSKTTAQTTTDIRDEAKKLAKTLSNTYYELSTVLYEIYTGNEWQKWGYENINDYLEQELNISYRTGMYYINIGEWITKNNISKEQVEDIGWTKLKEIIKAPNPDTLIETAKEVSTKELENIVRAEKGNKSDRVSMHFVFLEEQAEVVNKAIEIAGNLLNIDPEKNKSRCIEYVCLDFQTNYNPDIIDKIKTLMIDESKLKKSAYKTKIRKGE